MNFIYNNFFNLNSYDLASILANLNIDEKIINSETISKIPITLNTFIISLFLSLILSLIIGKVYIKKGKSLSNRRNLANIFPLLTITTTIIIAVIKSSLALSLGLVGALSIIRFRTPIKEPEELTYIFLSIAIGLGLGAEQYFATLIGTVFSVAAIFINHKISAKKDNLLNIQISNVEIVKINDLIDIILNFSEFVDLKNLIVTNKKEIKTKSGDINFVVLISSYSSINSLTQKISEFLPESEVFISDYQ